MFNIALRQLETATSRSQRLDDSTAGIDASRIDRKVRLQTTLRKQQQSHDLPHALDETSGVALSNSKAGTVGIVNAVRLPAVPAERISFQPLQEWEGYVISVGEETFTASLVDLTARDALQSSSAEFPISDLSESNALLLREGAVFRWVVGYLRSSGTKRRTSDIVFRRMPAWSKTDVENATRRAEEIYEALEWE